MTSIARQLEYWIGELDAVRSFTEIRARVVDVVHETPDTRTFVVAPNTRWQGHRAGQYLTVDVELDGVRVRRCYSISSAPDDPLLSFTVKRLPGGRVSGWLHAHVEPGDVLRLGAAAGDFVLDEPAPPRLLLLSGGSGVTPTMSILRDLAGRGAIRDVVFVHHARTRKDVIFREAVESLAAHHPGLRVVFGLDDDPAGQGGFDEARLARLVPDFATRPTYLCGPAGLMDRVERMWADAGASANLRHERFVAARPAVPPAGVRDVRDLPAVQVRLTRSRRSIAASGAVTLLEQLEQAGERPAYGCRMGICHTCKCRKQRGTVQNLLTGALSSEPDEDIQLCISVPRSDLELER